MTTAVGPVLGGFLTDTFGWQSVFWINPPLAVLAAGALAAFAPQERRESRSFDVIGAAILASALGSLAWALGQIGLREPAAAIATVSTSAKTFIAAGLGGGGLVVYAFWERASKHPMTPPRLLENRAFVGLNLATLTSYTGLSIMFFLTPFDLIDRRGLTSTGAALAFLPFTLGLALLSRTFGGLADAMGARAMLIAGPIGAAVAYIWMALGHDASLLIGVIGPMALLGTSFAVLVAPLTASILSSVGPADEGLAAGVNSAISRVAQLIGIALAAGVASFVTGYEIALAGAAVVTGAAAMLVATTVPPS